MDQTKLCAVLLALMLVCAGAAAAAAGKDNAAEGLKKAALAAAGFEANAELELSGKSSTDEQDETSPEADTSEEQDELSSGPEDIPQEHESSADENDNESRSLETPSEKPSAQALAAVPFPAEAGNSDGSIEKTHYGSCTGEQYFDLEGGGQVRNCTELENSFLLELSREEPDFEFETNGREPVVLIYHTHTSESFESEDRSWCDTTYQSKTTDPEKNVVAVGDRICAELEAAGIPYIHDTLIHDWPSYTDAYDSSRRTVSQLLAHYPSVKIVLDIHRDGIEREDGTRVAPVAEINGKEAAQIMIISGCDDGTMDMPNYLKNFRFACKLQSAAESLFPGLTRPMLFDYRHYNQDLSTGALLVEVGSHGNSLGQALYSGELLGKAIASLFRK